jgi:hypothetical protein
MSLYEIYQWAAVVVVVVAVVGWLFCLLVAWQTDREKQLKG